MGLTGTELARRANGRVEMRHEALRLRLRLRDISAADTHLIDLDFTCSVRALDERGEREMFEEVFLTGREAATVEDVGAHFTPPLRQAACALALTQPAEHWMSESSRQSLIDALRAAAKPVAFASGVELLPPFECVVTSRTRQREQLDAMERKLAQRRHAGHVENVQRAAELLKEFAALRQTMPDLPPGRLLGQVVPANQGSMLQSLLMASAADATAMLYAVAGSSLLRIDPRATSATVETIPLSSELGPLRSVQADGARLLVGAQSGVMVVDPAKPGDAVKLRDPQITSHLGFNSIARCGAMIWASHSDGGVVAWDSSDPDQPRMTFRGARQARNLVALDDQRVLFSTASEVFVADAKNPPAAISSSSAAIVFIHVDTNAVHLVRASGEIEQLDRETLQRRNVQRRTGELSSAGALPWMRSSRLLLATADGPIHCVGGDDPLVTQYLSPHRGLRAIAAGSDIVAALSADRQRIVLWNSWAGESPLAEIHIASIARNRAADICFG